jgi:hypothetical protein
VVNYYSNNVSVLLGKGDGTFHAARNFSAGIDPRSVAVGDVNGDGLLDLAVANYGSANVSVLLGNGEGSFQAARNFSANRPSFVTMADINRDGILDLVTTGSVLLGNGDGTFQPAMNHGGGGESVAVGDVNGDGVLDLAVAHSGGVRVLLGNGDGTFQTTHVSYVAGVVPSSVAIEDFNGDGWLDLAVANNGSNDVSILDNDGKWPAGPGGGSGPAAGRHQGKAGDRASGLGRMASTLPAFPGRIATTLPEAVRSFSEALPASLPAEQLDEHFAATGKEETPSHWFAWRTGARIPASHGLLTGLQEETPQDWLSALD